MCILWWLAISTIYGVIVTKIERGYEHMRDGICGLQPLLLKYVRCFHWMKCICSMVFFTFRPVFESVRNWLCLQSGQMFYWSKVWFIPGYSNANIFPLREKSWKLGATSVIWDGALWFWSVIKITMTDSSLASSRNRFTLRHFLFSGMALWFWSERWPHIFSTASW